MKGESDLLERLQRARAYIEERTIQLYFRADGGNPVAIGSGTLLQVREARLIVTAAHVLKWIRAGDGRLGVFNDDALFEHIGGETAEFVANVAEDLAVLRIDAESVQAVSTRHLVGIPDLIADEDLTHFLCGVVGYPTEKTRVKAPGVIEFGSYAAFLPVTAGDRTLANFDPTRHLLLANTDLVDEDFGSTTGPRLGGMSGCGVWAVIDRRQDAASWSESAIRFVGVETGTYHEGRLIKATRAKSVLQLTFDRWKDLRPRLEGVSISGDGSVKLKFR